MAGMLALALKANSLLTSLAYSFRVCSFNTDYCDLSITTYTVQRFNLAIVCPLL